MGPINSISLYFGLHRPWCNGPSGPIGPLWASGPLGPLWAYWAPLGLWAYGASGLLWGPLGLWAYAPPSGAYGAYRAHGLLWATLQGGQSPVKKVSNKKAFCISDRQEL